MMRFSQKPILLPRRSHNALKKQIPIGYRYSYQCSMWKVLRELIPNKEKTGVDELAADN
jgi:hypothetical protein